MADTAEDDYAIDQKAAEAPLLPRSTTRNRSSTADRYKPLALRMMKLTICLGIANVIVVLFLCALVYEYMRPNGLRSTFYTLKDEFGFAETTIQSMNTTLNELQGLFAQACLNIAPNVYEICAGIEFEHKSQCTYWSGQLTALSQALANRDH